MLGPSASPKRCGARLSDELDRQLFALSLEGVDKPSEQAARLQRDIGDVRRARMRISFALRAAIDAELVFERATKNRSAVTARNSERGESGVAHSREARVLDWAPRERRIPSRRNANAWISGVAVAATLGAVTFVVVRERSFSRGSDRDHVVTAPIPTGAPEFNLSIDAGAGDARSDD